MFFWRKSRPQPKPSYKSTPSKCSSLTPDCKSAPQQRKTAADPNSGIGQSLQGGSPVQIYYHRSGGVKYKCFSHHQHGKGKRLTCILCLWGTYRGSCLCAELARPLFRNALCWPLAFFSYFLNSVREKFWMARAQMMWPLWSWNIFLITDCFNCSVYCLAMPMIKKFTFERFSLSGNMNWRIWQRSFELITRGILTSFYVADAVWISTVCPCWCMRVNLVKVKVPRLAPVAKQTKTAFLHGPAMWKVADCRGKPTTSRFESAALTTASESVNCFPSPPHQHNFLLERRENFVLVPRVGVGGGGTGLPNKKKPVPMHEWVFPSYLVLSAELVKLLVVAR